MVKKKIIKWMTKSIKARCADAWRRQECTARRLMTSPHRQSSQEAINNKWIDPKCQLVPENNTVRVNRNSAKTESGHCWPHLNIRQTSWNIIYNSCLMLYEYSMHVDEMKYSCRCLDVCQCIISPWMRLGLSCQTIFIVVLLTIFFM